MFSPRTPTIRLFSELPPRRPMNNVEAVAYVESKPCSAELWSPSEEWAITDWARAYCSLQWLKCDEDCGA